jgi:hypothetical protein
MTTCSRHPRRMTVGLSVKGRARRGQYAPAARIGGMAAERRYPASGGPPSALRDSAIAATDISPTCIAS